MFDKLQFHILPIAFLNIYITIVSLIKYIDYVHFIKIIFALLLFDDACIAIIDILSMPNNSESVFFFGMFHALLYCIYFLCFRGCVTKMRLQHQYKKTQV